MCTLRSLSLPLLLAVVALLAVGCDGFETGTPPDAVQEGGTPTVQFASGGAGAVPTDSTLTIGVTLSDSVGPKVTVEVLFANQASSASSSDIGGFSADADSLVTFSKGAVPADTQFVTVNVKNADLSKGPKEAIFALQQLQSEGNVTIGTPEQFSLNIGATPIAEARSDGVGTTATIRGTVTRAFGSYVRLQDDSGPTGASGIVIRQTFGGLSGQFQQDISDGKIQPGTELLLTGKISQFSGLLQINNEDLSSYAIVTQGDPPAPQPVSLSEIKAPAGEKFVSELIRVDSLSFPASDTSSTFDADKTYTVTSANGASFMFRIQGSDETNIIGKPIPDGMFTYEGILAQFNGFSGPDVDEGYQLIPMRATDVKPQ